jgi:hypothetical protein
VAVLVDEPAARGVSSDRLARSERDDYTIVRRALAERTVGSVGVVVLHVVAQEPLELAAVPDERAVAEFAAHNADPWDCPEFG